VSSRTEDDRQTPGNTADDLELPASETYWQSCKEVFKVTKGFSEAKGGHS